MLFSLCNVCYHNSSIQNKTQRPLRARSQSLRPGKAPVAAVESEFKAFGGNYFFHNEIAAPFKDAGLFEWFVEQGETTK